MSTFTNYRFEQFWPMKSPMCMTVWLWRNNIAKSSNYQNPQPLKISSTGNWNKIMSKDFFKIKNNLLKQKTRRLHRMWNLLLLSNYNQNSTNLRILKTIQQGCCQIHSSNHTKDHNRDCLIMWIGCSTPSKALPFLSCHIVQKMHRGAALQALNKPGF